MARNIIKNIIRKIIRKKAEEPQDISYEIEGYNLLLPHSHQLPNYQNSFKNYDKKLKIIVEQIDKRFKNVSSTEKRVIIDIGANVGDTVASIRPYTKSHIYSIEGDAFYLPYLNKNLKKINDVTIIESYVSGEISELYGNVDRKNGTARLNLDKKTEEKISVINSKSLNEIISENYINVQDIDLIKIDTDGFDFTIILGNKEIINLYKPNLYFEYDISFNDDDENTSLQIVDLLEKGDYKLIIYDNFGNLLDFSEHDHLKKFKYLNHYLMSCRKYGGGIYYLDIFATIDTELANRIIENDI